MKLFGEYLIEKGLISEDQLLSLYLEQMSSAPSLPEVIFKRKLMTHTQILTALAHMAKHAIDFREACRELGFWTRKIQIDLEQDPSHLSIPICKILTERKLIDLPVLNQAMDAYLKENQSKDNPVPPTPLAGKHTEMDWIFDQKCQFKLHTLFSALVDLKNETELPSLIVPIRDACETLRVLRGVSRLAHTQGLEKLVEHLEKALDRLLEGPLPLKELNALGLLGLRGVEHLSAQKRTPGVAHGL